MPQFGRKTIKRSIDVIEIFLKVKGFLDEKGNPTEKAEGMLSINPEGNICILKPGQNKFDKIMKSHAKTLHVIAHLPNLSKLTSDQVKIELIKRRAKI